MAHRSPAALAGRRCLDALPILFGVVTISFVLTHILPGDPAAYFAGLSTSAEAVEQVRRSLGLDRSLPEQYLIYLQHLAQGDLGQSLTTGRPVTRELAERLPATLELALLALGLSTAIAVPLGMLAATRPNSLVDHACRVVTTAGVSLPTFFTGLLLIYVFYYLLSWSPAPLGRLDSFTSPPPAITGFYLLDALLAGDLETFRAALAQLVLPVVTLAVFTLAPLARMTRGAMLGVLASDFIRSARALGLPRGRILIGYALRNALLPVLTTLGVVFSFLLGGIVLIEKVFAWPGVGAYALEALIALDYAPVQGFVLLMGLLYVLVNLSIDILCGFVDPRVGIES